MNKFSKVVTYEFGTALVVEMLGMMDALGMNLVLSHMEINKD